MSSWSAVVFFGPFCVCLVGQLVAVRRLAWDPLGGHSACAVETQAALRGLVEQLVAVRCLAWDPLGGHSACAVETQAALRGFGVWCALVPCGWQQDSAVWLGLAPLGLLRLSGTPGHALQPPGVAERPLLPCSSPNCNVLGCVERVSWILAMASPCPASTPD